MTTSPAATGVTLAAGPITLRVITDVLGSTITIVTATRAGSEHAATATVRPARPVATAAAETAGAGLTGMGMSATGPRALAGAAATVKTACESASDA
ncbi:MAG TPA: hypothetical protein VN767_07335 [Streptosporangiaceae bacterium]|nr:hypothetical protein [Streptosporangiaceae bacterium]